MSWLVVVEHQVNDVGGSGNKDNLEGSVPQAPEWIGPKEICYSVECLSKCDLREGMFAKFQEGLSVPRYLVTYTTR